MTSGISEPEVAVSLLPIADKYSLRASEAVEVINAFNSYIPFPAQILPPQNDNSEGMSNNVNEVFPMMQVGPYINPEYTVGLRACLRHSVISSDVAADDYDFNVFRFALIGESRVIPGDVTTYPEYVQRILPEHLAGQYGFANAYFLAQKLAVNGGLGYHLFLHCVTTAPISAAPVIYTADGVQSKKDLAIEDKAQSGEVQLDFVMASTLDKTVDEAANFTKPTKLWDRLVKVLPMKAIHTFRMTGQTVLDIDALKNLQLSHLV
ncbi:hypothetical protein SPFM1_00228 [Salmonella phage SPFM1]|nr:hypothetical protein SPFM1_00228 [Salmonella phage SPFM1]